MTTFPVLRTPALAGIGAGRLSAATAPPAKACPIGDTAITAA